jgi:hypothetical protein
MCYKSNQMPDLDSNIIILLFDNSYFLRKPQYSTSNLNTWASNSTDLFFSVDY